MKEYLGQEIVKQEDTEFKDFTKSDWALYFIERYGQIDGAHHKAWVLDQCSRILNGSKIIINKAIWKDEYFEYRVSVDSSCEKYNKWVHSMLGEYDEDLDEYEYGYEHGIAP